MNFDLSWDLLALVVGGVVFAYNFILGQNSTLKLIISIYISVLASDGVAEIIKMLVFDTSAGLQSMSIEKEQTIFIIIRMVLFIIGLVWLVSKGGFKISVGRYSHWTGRSIIHVVFSMLSMLLFLSTIVILVSGYSLFTGVEYAREIALYQESKFIRILIEYYQIWFSLPAVAFLVSSHFLAEDSED